MVPVVLSPRDLAGCEHRVALDFAHDRRPADEPDPPGVQRRKEAAADHRAAIRELLRGVHSDQPGAFVVVDADASTAERVAATLRACDAGASWIWNATLPTDREHGRRGHSELLVRVGDGYTPVIVVNHRVSQPAKSTPEPDGRAPSLVTSPFWMWALSRSFSEGDTRKLAPQYLRPDGRRGPRRNSLSRSGPTHCSLRRPELAEAVTKGPGEMRRQTLRGSSLTLLAPQPGSVDEVSMGGVGARDRLIVLWACGIR